MPEPVLIKVGIDWSDAEKQLDQAGAKMRAAAAKISAPVPPGSAFDESKIAKLGDTFARVGEKINAASLQLKLMGATNPAEKANAAFEIQAQKIQKLLEITGDQAAADKALAAAQENVAKGAGRASAGAMNLFHQLKDMVAGLASGQNPMQILAQQGPQVLDAFEMGGGAAATLGSALSSLMGPASFVIAGLGEMAVAGTALYGIYASLNEVETIHNQVLSDQSAAYQALTPLLDDTLSTEIKLKEQTGELTKEMAGMEVAAIQSFGQYNQAVEATKKSLSDLYAAQASVTTQLVDDAESWVPAWTPLGMAIRGLTNDAADYQQQIDGANASMDTAARVLSENHDRHIELAAAEQKEREEKEKQTAARKAHTAALHDEKDSLKALNDAMAAENAQAEKDYATYTKATNALLDMQTKSERAGEASRFATQRATLAYNDQLAAIDKLRREALSATSTVEGREEAELRAMEAKTAAYQEYTDTIVNLGDKAYAELDRQRQEDLKREQQAAASKRQLAFGYVEQIGETLSLIDNLIGDSNERQKKAHKALAVAQILISGAVGIGKDIELGWPAMLPAMVFTTAQTALQIAAVERAHQGRVLIRHQGGGVDYPDELRILRSEIGGILNSQATRRLGEQGVAALNSGGSPTVTVYTKIGRVESNEITRLDTLSNGPITNRMRQQRASTALDTGFRGKMAPA